MAQRLHLISVEQRRLGSLRDWPAVYLHLAQSEMGHQEVIDKVITMPAGIERRQHPRATVVWPVIIRSARGFMSGETKDVSYSGAFIRCREPLKPSEVVEMSISVSLLCPRVQARCEVIWSNAASADAGVKPRGMGVRFIHIDDTDRELISALVADHLKDTDPLPPDEGSTDY